jgi:methylated-DNA-[protein]-cysteine S-methyltransferase
MGDAHRLFLDRMPTPIGELLVIVDAADRLRATDWADHEERLRRSLRRQFTATSLEARRSRATDALANYFGGDLDAIDAVDVETGGTSFQRSVWTALRTLRAGGTTSYAALARQIGRPTAIRAVGLANGSNPVSIVVPCHRVIGSDGSLTGYGGGLERKRWLLAHERASLS